MSNKVLVKMYRAVDCIDVDDSMFAVNDDTGEVAVSTYRATHSFSNPDTFGFVNLWAWSESSRFNDAINPVLIWESEIPVSKEDM